MNTKRTIVIIVFIIATLASGWLLFKNRQNASLNTAPTDTLTWNGAGLGFTYPKELTAYQQDDNVVLHHEIPYQNTGACDMAEEGNTYDKLTDFHLTMRIIDSPLVQTVKSISPYIPEENFDGDALKVNPGFIDSFEAGTYKGFVIYEGAEGCGVITYYFPLSSTRTLLMQRASIQALSGVRGEAEVQKILAVPGVLSKEVSYEIFVDILNSLIIK